jgi:pimeloyl-ACP methyl ester carboxylesterase
VVAPAETLMVEIPGGRRIEALVSGPRDGMVLVFHNGTPVGMAPIPPFADPGRRGLRTVQYARPGYLGSSPHPGRRVADAAADAAAVLDALGVGTFVTLGWSGGGPRALACGALLPGRCLATSVVAGGAPFGEAPELFPADDAGTYRRALAGDDSPILERARQTEALYAGATAGNVASMFELEADRAALTGELAEWMAAMMRSGFASGIEGAREDEVACADWGFPAAQARNVAIWHGDDDPVATVAHGRWLAQHIPGAQLHLLHGEGHVSIARWLPEIYDDLIARAKTRNET